MNRRQFIKGLLGSAATVPFLKDVNLPEFEENLDSFTDKELKSISEIENITLYDYTPYFAITDKDGNRVNSEYRVEMKNGDVWFYADVRNLKERFGNILDYWRQQGEDLPDLYDSLYNENKGVWL